MKKNNGNTIGVFDVRCVIMVIYDKGKATY